MSFAASALRKFCQVVALDELMRQRRYLERVTNGNELIAGVRCETEMRRANAGSVGSDVFS